MTVIVGVKCTDGIVIGSDGIATSSAGVMPVMQIESNDKIKIFDQSLVCATTGAVGVTQRLHSHIEAAIKGQVFKNEKKHEAAGNLSYRLIKDLNASMHHFHANHGYGFGALVAVSIKDEPLLIEYSTDKFQHEFREGKLFYASSGSGQSLADPFLAFVSRVLWRNTLPSVRMGKFGVYWTLNHTINLAPGTVGHPIKMATLTKDGGKWIACPVEDNDEAAQFIDRLEISIGNGFSAGAMEPNSIPLPPAPSD